MRTIFTLACIVIGLGLLFFQSSNVPMLFLAGWIFLLGFSPQIAFGAVFFVGLILAMMMLA